VEDAVKQRVLIAFVLFLVPVAGAQVYTVIDLGTLSPTAINTWGEVVGNFNGRLSSGGNLQAGRAWAH
jgi:hypothetical protein